MSEMTPIIGDAAVTIVEALKRLGSQAPARPSFDAAVNKGKIREIIPKENNPGGKRMVSWGSVLEHIERGGFKKRGKAIKNATPENETQSAAEQPTPARSIPSGENNNSGTKDRKSPKPEPPPVTPAQAKTKETHVRDVNKPRSETKSKVSTGNQQKPASGQGRAKAKLKSNEAPDTKGPRRTPPLRVLKNSLRRLDFEATKNIRDWMDNRLLTTLRPAAPVLANSKEETKQTV